MKRPDDRLPPQRTCVQCGRRGGKREFLRIAGRPGGDWSPDRDGRMPGRGIYLCRESGCVEGFLRRIRSAKGASRWKMGAAGAVLADRLAAWWSEEAES